MSRGLCLYSNKTTGLLCVFSRLNLGCCEFFSAQGEALILRGPFSSSSLLSDPSRSPVSLLLHASPTALCRPHTGAASSGWQGLSALCPLAPPAAPGPVCCPDGGTRGPSALRGLLRGHLPAAFPSLHEAQPRAAEGLFPRAWRHSPRGSGLPLTEGGLRLEMCKKFWARRLPRPWPTLPTEAVAAPWLAVFQASLDGARSNLA